MAAAETVNVCEREIGSGGDRTSDDELNRDGTSSPFQVGITRNGCIAEIEVVLLWSLYGILSEIVFVKPWEKLFVSCKEIESILTM